MDNFYGLKLDEDQQALLKAILDLRKTIVVLPVPADALQNTMVFRRSRIAFNSACWSSSSFRP